MTQLSDILMYITRTKKEERLEKADDASMALQMLSMSINADKSLLASQITTADRKYSRALEVFNLKNEALNSITGELDKIEDYPTAGSRQIVDNIKSPILDTYENHLNKLALNQNQLENAIIGVNQKLSTLDKVTDFFAGETTTPKGGIDPERWDIGDFGWKVTEVIDPESEEVTYKKEFDYTAIREALGLGEEDKIPEYVGEYIKTQTLGQDVQITSLNQLLDQARHYELANKLDEYKVRKLDLSSFETGEYISELNITLSTILDPNVSDVAVTTFLPVREKAAAYSEAIYANDNSEAALANITLLKGELDVMKADIGMMITMNNNETDDEKKENLEKGSKLLVGLEAYYQSLGEETRKILPWASALEEIYFYDKSYINDEGTGELQMLLKTKGANSPEYRKKYAEYEAFQKNVSELTNWSFSEYEANIDLLLDTADEISNESILMLEQVIKEKEIHRKDQQEDLRIKARLEAQAPALPDLGEKGYQHGIDYSQIPGSEKMFNLDTDDDGIPDAIDYHGGEGGAPDGMPDTIEQLSGGSEIKDYDTDYDTGYKIKPGEIVSGDYIYNPNTRKLKTLDGKLDRKITDPSEHIYFSYHNKTGNAVVNTEIDRLKDLGGHLFDAMIPYVKLDKSSRKAVLDYDQIIKDLISLGKNVKAGHPLEDALGDTITGWNPKVFVTPQKLIPQTGSGLLTSPAALVSGLFSEGVPLEHWTIYNALGGGHAFGRNSPFFETYLNVLRLEYNQSINRDSETWMKWFWKKHETGEFLGQLDAGWSEDFELPNIYRDHYPGDFKEADAIALKAASRAQRNWVKNILMGKDTPSAQTQWVPSGYSGEEIPFDKSDQYDILRVLGSIYGMDI